MFTSNNQSYDIFRDVDLSCYEGFWAAWQEFQTGKDSFASAKVEREYQYDTKFLNPYGDRIGDKGIGRQVEWTTRLTLNANNQLTQTRAAAFNRVNALIRAKSAAMVFTFAPCDVLRIQNADWQEIVDAYTAHFAEMLDCPVISNVATYFMGAHDLDAGMTPERQEMYDSVWHCSFYGANIRTIELAYDIQQFLTKGGTADSYENYLERETHKADSYPLTWGEGA